MYVPKSKKDISSISWRRSYSQEEKNILKDIDKNNGCRREVIRTLKVLFKGSSNLKSIPSYFLKTALFHTVDHIDNEVSWNVVDYPQRVFDMLLIMQRYFQKRWLPNYHVPEQNLLADYDEKALGNMENFIKCIRQSEKKFKNNFKLV